MVFFGKNLKSKHKVTLCLVALGILANVWLCNQSPVTLPFVEYMGNGTYRFNSSKIVLSFGIFVKMLVICIFRKF